MCGVVGVLKTKGYKINEELLVQMRDTMYHRGPDGGGIWIDQGRKVGFGHRRLSILDLSTVANQPMSNHDDTVWLTYNGEIYNFNEIKEELQASDYSWKTTHSDTEVIIHAYEEWGIDFIYKLRGQFAIAIYDTKKEKLFLVRDRLGIKPLYYLNTDDQFVFASEIKAIINDPSVKRELDEESFYHYLSFLTTPAPNTLFKNIKKLHAGSYLEIQLDSQSNTFRFQENKYWSPGDNVIDVKLDDEQELVNELRLKIRDSVKSHKVSDVPTGVFLSGGIDSGLNAALFSENENEPIKTFTITYDDKYSYKSEAPFARMVSNKINSKHFEHELSVEDMVSFIDRMIFLQDEPIADPVCVPVYYVSKLAKDNGVTVCHVGEGADELFWGYPYWRTSMDLHNSQHNFKDKIVNFTKRTGAKLLNKASSKKYEYLRRLRDRQDVFWGGAEMLSEAEKKQLLSKEYINRNPNLNSYSVIDNYKKKFEKSKFEKSRLNWMGFLDLNLRLPELLLMRVDKMSMGVSIETRVPFLDHHLVEYAMSIPESIRTKDRTLKYILKKAAEGIIPDEIIYRNKQGFGVPLEDWFHSKLGDFARKEIQEFIGKTDLFDKEQIHKLIDARSSKLWYILNFVMWYNKFILQK